MLEAVHVDVMRRALGQLFTPHALAAIIASNVRVDALWNQFGRDELHFDNNAFERSYAYMDGRRRSIRPALESGRTRVAWQAFGRLTHTAQDFYSHTNYVVLWLESRPNGVAPTPSDIDPLDRRLVGSPSLRSGKPYMPFGALSFVPGIAGLVDRLMPADSHARMHLDSADRGVAFEFAFEAAVKRTRHEYSLVVDGLSHALARRFRGLASPPGVRQGA